jgi:hypothetical protein
MSKRQRAGPEIMPGPETGEQFMAMLLWSQQSSCSCPACEYLRGMANRLIRQHVPEVKQGG